MKTEIKIKDKTKSNEGLKIDLFRKNIRKTSPHKHNNYFEIIYLTKGTGTHTIDTKEYTITTPVIFNIRKQQVHFWDIKTEPEGFVLIIKKQFIDNCFDKDIKQFIAKLSSLNYLTPKDNAAVDIFNLLLKEHQENNSLKKPVIDGLLKALLGKLLESAKPTSSKNVSRNDFERFRELLNQGEILGNSVAQYASLLNTSPQNLNAICRKENNQSAAEIISEFIISEAKRLLLYTNLTVSEISNSLDFKDNSHFSKYFKRNVGTTPINFRKESL